MNAHRVRAVVKRHFFVTLYSPPRLLDSFFWPVVDLLLWGLLSSYLQRHDTQLQAPAAFLLGGILLWDLVFRTANGVALAFMEESWTRNLINIMASPMSASEYVAGAFLWALTKVAVGWAIITTAAYVLFSFAVTNIGLALIPFAAALLLFGLALGIFVFGLVLRFGNGANILAWALSAMVIPFAAVFYPVSVLPGWAREVALAMPAAHIFEGMRAVLASRPAPWDELSRGLGLDVVYLAAAFIFCRTMFATLRRRGYVTRFM